MAKLNDGGSSNLKFTLGEPVPTFTAWYKDTGEAVTVDERTFDAETMTKEDPHAPAA